MKKIKVYVGRTVEDGLPRCWGRTMKECEKAIQMWLYKQIRNKPIQMWEIETDYNSDENSATYDPFLGGVEAVGKSDFFTSPPKTLK